MVLSDMVKVGAPAVSRLHMTCQIREFAGFHRLAGDAHALTVEVAVLCVFLLLNNCKLDWDKAGFRN